MKSTTNEKPGHLERLADNLRIGAGMFTMGVLRLFKGRDEDEDEDANWPTENNRGQNDRLCLTTIDEDRSNSLFGNPLIGVAKAMSPKSFEDDPVPELPDLDSHFPINWPMLIIALLLLIFIGYLLITGQPKLGWG